MTVLDGDPTVDLDGSTEWDIDTDGGDWDNQVLFAGYRHDPETGLYHVRYRYHHPSLGRWITRDPIARVIREKRLMQSPTVVLDIAMETALDDDMDHLLDPILDKDIRRALIADAIGNRHLMQSLAPGLNVSLDKMLTAAEEQMGEKLGLVSKLNLAQQSLDHQKWLSGNYSCSYPKELRMSYVSVTHLVASVQSRLDQYESAIQYVDGANLYEHVGGRPAENVDPFGTAGKIYIQAGCDPSCGLCLCNCPVGYLPDGEHDGCPGVSGEGVVLCRQQSCLCYTASGTRPGPLL